MYIIIKVLSIGTYFYNSRMYIVEIIGYIILKNKDDVAVIISMSPQ